MFWLRVGLSTIYATDTVERSAPTLTAPTLGVLNVCDMMNGGPNAYWHA